MFGFTQDNTRRPLAQANHFSFGLCCLCPGDQTPCSCLGTSIRGISASASIAKRAVLRGTNTISDMQELSN